MAAQIDQRKMLSILILYLLLRSTRHQGIKRFSFIKELRAHSIADVNQHLEAIYFSSACGEKHVDGEFRAINYPVRLDRLDKEHS